MPGTSEKADPGPLEKAYRTPKIIFDKFEGADLKYDNTFLKFYPKNTQIRQFWSQI